MYCTECGTRNHEGAKFCRHCGKRVDVPYTEAKEAHEAKAASDQTHADTAQLVPIEDQPTAQDYLLSAYRARESGDLEAAMQSCARALDRDPSSAPAHALLSTLHENLGDLPKAISEREKVVDLCPDSIDDREKLEMLRKGVRQATPRKIVSARPLGTPVLFDSPAAAAFAALAVFLVIAAIGGVALYLRSRHGADPERLSLAASNNTPATTGAGWTGQNGPVGYQQPYQYPFVAQSPPMNADARAPVQPGGEQDRASRRYRDGSDTTGMDDGGVPPAPVNLRNNGFERALQNGGVTSDRGTDNTAFHLPDRATTSGADDGNPTPTAPPTGPRNSGHVARDPGRIEIVVSSDATVPRTGGNGGGGSAPSASTPSGSTPSSSGGRGTMDSRALRAVAQDLQLRGEYAKAADEYKKALDGAGDDSASLHYKIALCYQRLQRADDAIAHYNDAIRAYKKQVDAGKNVEVATQGIRASEAGINAVR